jgi:ureidoglycolate hydrolase
MAKFVDIELEPLSASAFAPFGQVIGLTEGPPVFRGPHIESWRHDFAADGDVEVMFTRYAHRAMTFSRVERHFAVTQAFVPLDGVPWVMAVAGPTIPEDPSAEPRPDSVRAFYVEGNRGIMLRKGAWHALTRFPVSSAGASFTGKATQQELERQMRGGPPPTLTQVVDFGERFGVAVRIEDPRGLLRAA